MTEAAETTLESFEDAFSKLADLDTGVPEAQAATTPAPASAEAPAEPPKVEEAPAEEPGAEATSEPPADGGTPAEEPAAAEKPAANAESEAILERLARLVQDTPPPPQPRQEPAQPSEPAIYTKEEQELLSSYEKDWPEVAKAESLRRKAEYRELVNYVFSEVAKEIRPIVDMVQTVSQRTHLEDLKSTVNDYDDVRDKVIDWVGQQPAYLQIAYKHVIENGTVDEVADLVDRYKRETGAAARPAVAPAPRKTETELPSATKQAAAALAPVSSKRSAVMQASDPEDFESAFAAFAGKL